MSHLAVRFQWNGRAYNGTTGQLTRQDAELVEHNEKLRVRREAYGIASIDPARSPLIADWAEVYYKDVTTRRRERIKRPKRIDDLIRVALRFWGRKPANPKPRDIGPFHNLRLIDPILEPQWILRFEAWMDDRGWAGQTKNQYRSLMSQLYKLAAAPAWTKLTLVDKNPFRELERDPKVTRDATASLEDLRKILAHAPHHIRLALAIGLLAHKLRRDNILALTWKEHILELGPRTLANGLTVYGWIKVGEDESKNRRPLVVPISEQLHTILVDARDRNQRSRTPSPFLVNYRGKRVADIRGGLKAICRRAGVPYGRFSATGITFHSLRHIGSTTLAELEIPDAKRQQASGHASSAALEGYTHLRPVSEIDTRERLSAAFPIADLVTATVRLVPDPVPDQRPIATSSNAEENAKTATTRRNISAVASLSARTS